MLSNDVMTTILKESEFLLRGIKPSIKFGMTGKGFLTLTKDRLYFKRKAGLVVKGETLLDIPLTSIRSADATKIWGNEALIIRYDDKNIVRTVTFSSSKLGQSLAKAGVLSMLTPADTLFSEWSHIITTAKMKK